MHSSQVLPCAPAGIEKVSGCNRVPCAVCRTNVCWICGAKLSGSNPYLHYQQPGPCANRTYGARRAAGPRRLHFCQQRRARHRRAMC